MTLIYTLGYPIFIHQLLSILAKSPRLRCPWMEPSIKWHPWEDQTNTLDHPSRRKLAAPIRLLNKAKRFANQLLSNVMNALACVYCCEQSKLVGEEVQEKAALVFC